MPPTPLHTRLIALSCALGTTGALLFSASAAPAAPTGEPRTAFDGAGAGLDDVDLRGTALPSAAQRSAAGTLDAQVRWNSLGTPAAISPSTGDLGPATGSAIEAARGFADGSVRPVFAASVVNIAGGAASAYTVLVDGISGKVWARTNQVEQHSDAFTFQGSITATECGPKHAFELKDDLTRQIVATAAMALTTNDSVVKVFSPAGDLHHAGLPVRQPDGAVRGAG